jgi:hypothetical protein
VVLNCSIVPFAFTSTAYADDGVITVADTSKSQPIIPLSEFLEASLDQDMARYNSLAKYHNIGAIAGSKASFLNENAPMDNSYSLLHQLAAASIALGENQSNSFVSTDAFIKHEVVYIIPPANLDEVDIARFFKEGKKPIIYFFDQQ